MKYRFLSYDGCPMVEIDDKIYLIDTGLYPCSITFNESESVIINGVSFNLMGYQVSPEIQKRAFGRTIDGAIGNDIFRYFGKIEVDKKASTVMFGTFEKKVKNPIYYTGLFHMDVMINGYNAKGFMDTGAHIPAIFKHQLLDNAKYLNEYEEPTFFGNKNVSLYEGSIELNGKQVLTKMIKSSSTMVGEGSDVYFGMDQLASHYYLIDFIDKYVDFE